MEVCSVIERRSGQDEQEGASAARRGSKAKVVLETLCNKATVAELVAAKYQLRYGPYPVGLAA